MTSYEWRQKYRSRNCNWIL